MSTRYGHIESTRYGHILVKLFGGDNFSDIGASLYDRLQWAWSEYGAAFVLAAPTEEDARISMLDFGYGIATEARQLLAAVPPKDRLNATEELIAGLIASFMDASRPKKREKLTGQRNTV